MKMVSYRKEEIDMKTLFKIIVVSALLAVVAEARADTWLNVHLLSKHVNADQPYDYNENNYGLGIIHEWQPSLDVRVGAFKNSFDHTSAYAGIGWHTSYNKPVSMILQAGMSTGYKDTPVGGESALIGYVLPTVSFNTKRVRVEVGYIPKAVGGDIKSDVITVSIPVRF